MQEELVPSTTERVPQHTDKRINALIWRQTDANVAYYATRDRRSLDIRL